MSGLELMKNINRRNIKKNTTVFYRKYSNIVEENDKLKNKKFVKNNGKIKI